MTQVLYTIGATMETIVNTTHSSNAVEWKTVPNTGVTLMDLRSVVSEVNEKLAQEDANLIILQYRQFESGKRCKDLYGALLENGKKTIINVDSSARNDFQRDFLPNQVVNATVHYTHDRFSQIPVAGKYVGRNHVRLLILNECAYVSSFDFAEPSFNRDELFIKVTQPEIVQTLKIISLWDYKKDKPKWNQKVGNFEIVFDTGKTPSGVISRYAENELRKNVGEGSNVWLVSSWCPDELNDTVNLMNSRGANINLLINRQYEWESLKKVPFNITKILSNLEFRNATKKSNYTIYNPTGSQIHAKFVLTEKDGKYWWLVGTSNHTKFGSQAQTTEIAISGTDPDVGIQLINYIQSIDKVKA